MRSFRNQTNTSGKKKYHNNNATSEKGTAKISARTLFSQTNKPTGQLTEKKGKFNFWKTFSLKKKFFFRKKFILQDRLLFLTPCGLWSASNRSPPSHFGGVKFP